MALNLSASSEVTFAMISSKDSAIRQPENYAAYLDTLDESLLGLEGEPTRFHLAMSNKLKDVLAAKDGMTSLAMKAKDGGDIPIYSLMFQQVRIALKDITTGVESMMRKGSDGLASDDLMAALAAQDILPELFAALQNKQANRSPEIAKKG
jgi:hypothetical protein